MCGIIGIASRSKIDQRDWLVAGRDAMAHRGPDDIGEWWSVDGRVGMGHRRLAVIDLSLAGHQPMQDYTKSLTIVFNGEIYNYIELRKRLKNLGYNFQSNSDTEVVLAAYREWGVECLKKFNGMFAFALYDSPRQLVFMARDRAGEKPLFYTNTNGELRFASELKGLISDKSRLWRLNPKALDMYLAMGYIPGDHSIIQGVNKLPPAHALVFDLETCREHIWRYWQLPHLSSSNSQFEEELLLEELEYLLEDSVSKQLVADVPVGVLLSGGVDSSLITAMAVRKSSKVKTFTVGFEGFGKYDESHHARYVARYFNTEHVELNAGNASPELLFRMARQFDEPMVDSSMIPTYLVCQLVREHCTVALGGDGGDELFGGYAHYDRLLWKKEKFDWIPLVLRALLSRASSSILPTGFKGRNWLQSFGCDLNSELPHVAVLFDGNSRKKLMNTKNVNKWSLVAEYVWRSRVPVTNNLLDRVTRMDFENYMVEDILVKIDRASMMNSLELRAPLLDCRIIEFAFGKVPSEMKATSSQRKILLKKLASKLLPSGFELHRKQGFSVPLTEWLKNGAWRDLFIDVLLDEQCIFDKKYVTLLFKGQDLGMNNNERLFGLVLFELWRREYRIPL